MDCAWPTDHDDGVKRATAIRHLVEMATTASKNLRLRSTDSGWPLEELWVTGDLLSSVAELDAGAVVLTVDVPTTEMPWLALHPTGEWIGDQLGLGKRPIRWCYRPLAWPPWNHEHRRVARFWDAANGLDDAVIDALRSRDLNRVHVVEPTDDELIEQLRSELVISGLHLRTILDPYWDHDWRRAHKGYDETPEDHLWRAATAFVDIDEALRQLT
jgi:hypothetical protein